MQSVNSAEKGGEHIDPHGYDAGKTIKGKKRHVLVDTEGLVLHAIVTAADVQDRDGGAWLPGTLVGMYPFLLKLYADGGYQGPEFRKSVKAVLPQVPVETVKRSDQIEGFVALPKRRGGVRGRSPGSTAAAAWARIGRTLITRHGHFN